MCNPKCCKRSIKPKRKAIFNVLEVLALVLGPVLALVTICAIASCERAEADSLDIARGAALLGAQHPTFPTERAIELLSAAAPHPAFAVAHKVFGQDFVRLQSIVDALLTHERNPSSNVTLIMYVDCGPCRPPRRPAGLFDLLLPSLDIPTFDRNLRNGSALAAFGAEVQAIAAGLPEQPGLSLVLVPVLEDGLSDEAFDNAASTIASVFAGRGDWSLLRNRLDNEPYGGYGREVHRLELTPSLVRGDLATADGQNICTRFDTNCNGMTLAHARNWVLSGEKVGAPVLLWRPEWQGLPVGVGSNPVPIPASERKMVINQLTCFKNVLRRK